MTPTPSQGPPIPQGGGGLMGYDHDHGRGGGGGTRNLEHIYIYTCILVFPPTWMIFVGSPPPPRYLAVSPVHPSIHRVYRAPRHPH